MRLGCGRNDFAAARGGTRAAGLAAKVQAVDPYAGSLSDLFG
jgi:hypothetical protein